jgi:hypothetical protein
MAAEASASALAPSRQASDAAMQRGALMDVPDLDAPRDGDAVSPGASPAACACVRLSELRMRTEPQDHFAELDEDIQRVAAPVASAGRRGDPRPSRFVNASPPSGVRGPGEPCAGVLLTGQHPQEIDQSESEDHFS